MPNSYKLLIICGLLASLSSFTPSLSGHTVPSRSFDISYVVRITPPSGIHTMRVWLPMPSSDEFQTISQIRVDGPPGIQLRQYPQAGDRYAYLNINSDHISQAFDVQVAFHVIRYEGPRHWPAPAARQPKLPKEVLAFLQPTKAPHSEVTPVAQEFASVGELLERVRKIYECASANGESHDSSFQNSLIEEARAAGIPARLALGFLLPDMQQGTIHDTHSWAEFYVNEIGWIPFDALDTANADANRDSAFAMLDARRVILSVAHGPFGAVEHLGDWGSPFIQVDRQPYADFSTDVFFHESRVADPVTIIRRQIFG